MQFLCISRGNLSPNTVQLFAQACRVRGVTFTLIDPDIFDYTTWKHSNEPFLLYNMSAESPSARIVQEYLMSPRAVTFFTSLARSYLESDGNWAAVLAQKTGVSMPRTVFSLTRDRAVLCRAVEYLGGFPVVLKVPGGSHGVGVMKVDSLPALFSLIDYICKQGKLAMLREFIDVRTSARLIVLGSRVIDSVEYQAPAGDFRTNSGRMPQVLPKAFPTAVETLACGAVHALGIEFGGVDILIDARGTCYVTEVNFPCNFARAQLLTGTDIAGMMLDYLLHKARLRAKEYATARARTAR